MFSNKQLAVFAGAVLASTTGIAHADTLDALSALEWRSRVLLVVADAETAPGLAATRAAVGDRICEFDERDMALLVAVGEAAGPVRARYRVRAGQGVGVLVGKDGGEKYRTALPVDLDEVFRRIDGMPMRRAEQRRQGASGC